MPRDAIEEAVAAAFTAPSPHRVRPWRFTALETPAAKRALLGATAEARRVDLLGNGVDEATVGRRLDRSDAELGTARTLIVPWVRFEGPAAHADADRAHAERELSLLSAGAAIQSLLLALHAQGLASCWVASTLFCQEETRAVLGMDDAWFALGVVAVGRAPQDGAVRPRPPLDLDQVLGWR